VVEMSLNEYITARYNLTTEEILNMPVSMMKAIVKGYAEFQKEERRKIMSPANEQELKIVASHT
jgi:hypothetical protein